jgi:hypothetical protein
MSWNHASGTKYLYAALAGIAGQAATVCLWVKKTGSFGGREFGGININSSGALPVLSRLTLKTAAVDAFSNSTLKGSFANSSGGVTDTGDATGVFSMTPDLWHCLVLVRTGSSTTSRSWGTVYPNEVCIGRQASVQSGAADDDTLYAELAVWNLALSATIATTVLYTGAGAGKAADHADVGNAPIHYSKLNSSTQLAATVGTNLTEGGGAEASPWSADHPTITAAAGTAPTPTITDAGDELYLDGETGITITGTDFGAAQGAGFVVISPTVDVADVGAVTQTVTSWADTSITVTAVKGDLGFGTTAYLFVEHDGGNANAAGYAVTFETRGPQRRMMLGMG